MPIHILNGDGYNVHRFSVAGTLLEKYINHIAIVLEESKCVTTGDVVNVIHSVPPIRKEKFAPDFVVHIPLEDSQIINIRRFCNASRFVTKQPNKDILLHYVISPPYIDISNTEYRFSCAGLVIRAYEWAGINMIDYENVPKIRYDDIYILYRIDERRNSILKHLGMKEDPYAVVLPGYVVNAMLNYEISREVYSATDKDRYIPENSEFYT